MRDDFLASKMHIRCISLHVYVFHVAKRILRVYDLYQVDLVDVSSLSPFNDGMRFILVCIDVF